MSKIEHKLSQSKAFKSNRHRKITKKIPHWKIAEAVNASESMVKKVRSGDRSNETDLGQRIQIAEMLIEEGENKLLQEVKRVVQITSK